MIPEEQIGTPICVARFSTGRGTVTENATTTPAVRSETRIEDYKYQPPAFLASCTSDSVTSPTVEDTILVTASSFPMH